MGGLDPSRLEQEHEDQLPGSRDQGSPMQRGPNCSFSNFLACDLESPEKSKMAKTGVGNPLTICRGLLGPPGPKPGKKKKKLSWGLWPRDAPRVWKKSRKSLESLEKVSKISVAQRGGGNKGRVRKCGQTHARKRRGENASKR